MPSTSIIVPPIRRVLRKRKNLIEKPPLDDGPSKKTKSVVKNDTKKSTKAASKVISKNTCGNMLLGAHVSAAGGLYKAVLNAVEIGATSFALFLRSQRQWASKPLDDATAQKFIEFCKNHGFKSSQILPHGSYLMNCGSPKDEILQKSRNTLIDELKRCDKLGISMYNFHPGSTCGDISRKESIKKIAESINMAHAQTSNVTTVLENMSKQGNTIGGDFQELRDIIDLVDNKDRVGVCLDTCHAFAAGYDLSKEEGYKKMMNDFESIIGFPYLKALHLNDSKGKVGCHLDRHENIGKGFIKLDGFRRIMNDARFKHMPLILETPEEDYAKEIKLLQSLIEN